MVNPPATLSGSVLATYASISASVISAKCTSVDATAVRVATVVPLMQDHVVTGVQCCCAATNLLPAPHGLGRRSWLAVADAVDLEQGITSDDERGRRSMINPGIDRLRLELREARGQLSHAARGL